VPEPNFPVWIPMEIRKISMTTTTMRMTMIARPSRIAERIEMITPITKKTINSITMRRSSPRGDGDSEELAITTTTQRRPEDEASEEVAAAASQRRPNPS